MNLLEENRKPEKTGKQKFILFLLVISIILLVITIGAIGILLSIGTKTPKTTKIKINNKDATTVSQNFMITTTEGQTYISLKELASLLNYTYYNGGYLEFSENKAKCYIDNEYEIIGFEKNSNKIYKLVLNDKLGYQYFELNNNIIYSNDLLYINANDLQIALNVVIQNGNIWTTGGMLTVYQTEISKIGYSNIDSNQNNLKALAYNLIVVNKESRKGLINLNLEEIVGTKYNTMEFVELTNDFIVSSNGKFGIIKSTGETKVSLIYDDIKIFSYEPLLYIAKKDNQFGIIDKDGLIVASPVYDKIGFDENKTQNIESTLVIPEIINGIGKTIVVEKDNKYGLVEIDRRIIILDCVFDGIYARNIEDGVNYFAKSNGQEYSLYDYLEYVKNRL